MGKIQQKIFTEGLELEEGMFKFLFPESSGQGAQTASPHPGEKPYLTVARLAEAWPPRNGVRHGLLVLE